MTLRLHQRYTLDEAVAAFSSVGTPQIFYDQQFIVMDKVVLCLAEIGESDTQTHVASVSRVIWKPDQMDGLTPDQRCSLHDKVMGAWISGPEEDHPDQRLPMDDLIMRLRMLGRRERKSHHVFLRRPGDKEFLYAGKAHLGSYSIVEAEFTLDEKLPREEWARLGAFPGWVVDINYRTERIDKGDFAAFRRLTAGIADLEYGHLRLTRFEDDVLTLHTNAQRGWLMYQVTPADGCYSGCDPNFVADRQAKESFRCVCGIEMNCDAARTVERDVGIRAATDFFTLGDLPRTLRWR